VEIIQSLPHREHSAFIINISWLNRLPKQTLLTVRIIQKHTVWSNCRVC